MNKQNRQGIFWLQIAFIATAAFLCSCGRSDAVSNQTDDDADILVRLDRIITGGDDISAETRDSMLIANYAPVANYLYMMGMGNDDIRRSADTLRESASYRIFAPDVVNRFDAHEEEVSSQLAELNNQLKRNGIIDYDTKYYAVISPYRQSLMIADSTVYIALNHYLGSDYQGYQGMPTYNLGVKTPQHIVYDVAEALIDSRFSNKDYSDVSKRLLHEGALTYSILNLTGGNIKEMLGWSDDEFAFVNSHERDIWETLAKRNLLFSTSASDGDRLFNPSPATAIISVDLPGRVGRYVGLKIVESYMSKHPATSLSELLSDEFYLNPHTMIEAAYDPK